MLPRWLSGKESACSAGATGNWVQSLGQEDPLEEDMVTHSCIHPMDGGSWQAIVHEVTKVGYD